jgi:iron(III) transport system substrate-binding protein
MATMPGTVGHETFAHSLSKMLGKESGQTSGQVLGSCLGLCLALMTLMALLLAAGCRPQSSREVIVYAALDREFSEPILENFSRDTGIVARGVFDVESTKTVGLVNRLLEERARPRCDLFWNNEIMHTLRLQKEGILEVYFSPAAEEIPESYRSPDGYWTGFAARARVLLVNREAWGDDEPIPDSIQALADPRWKGRGGMARPLFGTTATHAAVLFAIWGEERALEFFSEVKENSLILSGNKQVALAVGRGELAFGLTDTDDAIIELEEGRPVEIIFPDQAADQIGTLYIPNTLAIIKNGPNPEAARQLVDYLLQPDVERLLEQGPSAQFPVRPQLQGAHRLAGQESIQWMEVDFAAAAQQWPQVAVRLQSLIEQ